jgi:hypothetical protein
MKAGDMYDLKYYLDEKGHIWRSCEMCDERILLGQGLCPKCVVEGTCGHCGHLNAGGLIVQVPFELKPDGTPKPVDMSEWSTWDWQCLQCGKGNPFRKADNATP